MDLGMTNLKPTSIHDSPEHFLGMGLRLIEAGMGDKAAALARQALVERGEDALLGALAGLILTTNVPSFHRTMLRDDLRNAAYRKAIESMAPGKRVLDIGTGSGLLAMMAARAGATHVYACEVNPMLAATAREIIAANGLAERITVITAHSNKLDRERDLGGGAELVVSEIFSNNVIGEGVLSSLADARGRLCIPGAVFLPQSAAIRVGLADLDRVKPWAGQVEGFCISLFSRHLPNSYTRRHDMPGLTLRNGVADLFSFDFLSDISQVEYSNVTLVVEDGPVNGIVQWLRLELAPGISYENVPGASAGSHWGLTCYPLAEERVVGDNVVVHGWHDQAHLAIWT
jgi:type III protein arginine methyltransferase